MLGATARVAGLDDAVCVNPSDHVSVHGPVPESAAWIDAEAPLQIVVDPDTTASQVTAVGVGVGVLVGVGVFVGVCVGVFVGVGDGVFVGVSVGVGLTAVQLEQPIESTT